MRPMRVPCKRRRRERPGKGRGAQSSCREKEQMLREARTQIAGLAADTASQILGQCTGVKTDEQIYEQFLKKAGEEQ